MNFHKFYFDWFPKFANILKEELKSKDCLTIEDNIKVFFEFFEKNNAYIFFKNHEITSDQMYIAVCLNNFESKIYLQRNLRLEGYDEEYQIQFELPLDLPPFEDKIYDTFEIKRDYNGDFSNSQEGYFILKIIRKKSCIQIN
jgi:hypothetical protein